MLFLDASIVRRRLQILHKESHQWCCIVPEFRGSIWPSMHKVSLLTVAVSISPRHLDSGALLPGQFRFIIRNNCHHYDHSRKIPIRKMKGPTNEFGLPVPWGWSLVVGQNWHLAHANTPIELLLKKLGCELFCYVHE
jgi:hypothetical protein